MQIGQVPGGGQSFGDIYRVNTPALDKFGQQMYVQEQQRQRQQQLDLQNLDNEFSKNMSNIRDADINDYSSAYDDYKNAYIQSIKQKKPLTLDQQKELMQKKAKVYSVMATSKYNDGRLQDYAKKIGADTKGLFADDAAQQVLSLNKVPSSQLSDDKYLSLLHQFGNTDFSGAYKYAAGTPKKVTIDEGEADPNDPTKSIKYNYNVGSNYLDYFSKLGEKVAGSKQQKDFTLLQNNSLPPDQEQALTIKFNEIVNNPIYKKLYGIDGTNNDFPKYAYEPNTLANAMRIATMQNVVSNPPVGSPEKYTNQTALMQAKDKIADENATVKFTRDKILRAMGEGEREQFYDYSQTKQQGIMNNAIDGMVDNQIAEAKKGTQWGEAGVLSVDPATLKAMGISRAILSPDGTKVIPVTDLVTGTKPDGTQIVTPTNGTPVTIEQWKAAYGKRDVGSKYFQKPETKPNTETKQTSSKTYKYNGKTYTQKQIENSAKENGLSVDDYLKQLGLQ